MEEHYRKLENMYHGAPCNDYYQSKLKIAEGAAELIIPVKKNLFHAAGAVHGSAYFKALDDSCFFAANSLVKDVFVLTVSFNLHLLRPIVSGEIKAQAKVIQASKNIIICEAIAYDSNGKEIAKGSGDFVRSKIPVTPDIGYK